MRSSSVIAATGITTSKRKLRVKCNSSQPTKISKRKSRRCNCSPIDSAPRPAKRHKRKASSSRSIAWKKLAPRRPGKTIKFHFPQPPRSGLRAITLKDVNHAYGDLVVYRGLNFHAERGQRSV